MSDKRNKNIASKKIGKYIIPMRASRIEVQSGKKSIEKQRRMEARMRLNMFTGRIVER